MNWYRLDLVAAYIAVALVFLLGILRPRQRKEWRSAGIASAWVIALYAEMYGIPLTLYAASSIFGEHLAPTEFQRGHFWAPFFGVDSPYGAIAFVVAGQAMILAGAILTLVAWRQLWKYRDGVATEGLYRYVRHPQYTGFFLFIIGSIINWPTLITIAMAPFLIWRYYSLAIQEEQDVLDRVGDPYREYMAATGRFVPQWHIFRG